jgi:lipopolysaccharide/colanic/teichoic acid biosynthesis glycosyltransferase
MRISAEVQPTPATWNSLSVSNSSVPPVQQGVGNYFRWKYWVERLLAALLLLPATLVIVAVGLLVRLTSPGPIIYRQLRVGRHGRTFALYKIRTMRIDAESASGPVWASPGDARITPIGRVLRKLHLDEFPQLINVLKGEMALVGPRPERPEFTQQLALRIPNYLERLAVLPGITGLAQINLPPDTDLDSVRRKVALDLEYIATAGWFLDMRMLLCTAVRLTGIHGELAMRMFGLTRMPPVVQANVDTETLPDLSTVVSVDQLCKALFAEEERIAHNHSSAIPHGTGYRNGTATNGAMNGAATNGKDSHSAIHSGAGATRFPAGN